MKSLATACDIIENNTPDFESGNTGKAGPKIYVHIAQSGRAQA